jgi:hypothetical protein
MMEVKPYKLLAKNYSLYLIQGRTRKQKLSKNCCGQRRTRPENHRKYKHF